MDKDTGGPAFPSQREHTTKEGMTLRDYFAAKAMQTLMADTEAKRQLVSIGMGEKISECLSHMAYQMADTMLKAREQA